MSDVIEKIVEDLICTAVLDLKKSNLLNFVLMIIFMILSYKLM